MVTTIEQVRAIKQAAEGKKVSLLGKLKEARAELEAPADPWLAPLQRVRGKLEFDGMERVSSQYLLDVLEVPQRNRTAGTYRRLAKLMAELDWTAVRVRDLTRGGYKEQVRGYVRDGRRSHTTGHDDTTADGYAIARRSAVRSSL